MVPTELEDEWGGGGGDGAQLRKGQKNLHLLGIETQFLGTPACNPDNWVVLSWRKIRS
jgi:hypothetical protein